MGRKFTAELTGSITATRVLPAEDGRANVEYSYAGGGTFDGREVTDVITYVSRAQEGGFLLGSAHSVVTAADGGDVATCQGTAVGRPDGGGIKWKCSVTVRSTSPAFKHLDGTIATATFTIDAGGKVVQHYQGME
ncbi:hypothetical protein [Saccharothrix algeriensis]|uniref:Uncharacterized protein n=1 Tax=Saccharothrix algeriensis TaxID=173560 RepID=A0ABS2S2D7_9PSEU|nr:hypothetical protein [Saccharothrix algeriensis]MBM7809849.1 hypothetical protein [Saccharothrix algeriensis]